MNGSSENLKTKKIALLIIGILLASPFVFFGALLIYLAPLAELTPVSEEVFVIETNEVPLLPEPCDMDDKGWCRQENGEPHPAGDMTSAVLFSLAHNRIDQLKPYIFESEWKFIDDWMLNHVAVSSKCGLGSEDMTALGGGGQHGFWYRLNNYCPNEYYNLEVRLSFIEVDGRLFVSSFDEVCLRRDDEDQCWYGSG